MKICGSAIAATLILLSLADMVRSAEPEEVVVSATKRGDVRVLDIPESIYVLDGRDIERKQAFNFEDIAANFPGLQFQDLGPGDKEYIIRGINGNGPAVVGAYFDEYVITSTDNQDGGGKNAPLKFVDMERVEVLNGPQGTLYGANSMAGNIRFIPRKPELGEFSLSADLDGSTTREGGGNFSISSTVNLPIVDDVFAIRVVGYRVDDDGWVDQPRLQTGPTTFDGDAENINGEKTDGGRLLLRWAPSDRLTVDGLVVLQNLRALGSSRFTAKGTPAFPDVPERIAAIGGGFTPLPGLDPITPYRDYINTDITSNTRDDRVRLFGATAAYRSDFGTLSLAGSHFGHDIEYIYDSTPLLLFFGVPIPAIPVELPEFSTKMLEARFASDFDGRFNLVTGIYYQKEQQDWEVRVTKTNDRGGTVPWDPLNANDVLTAGGTAFFGRKRSDEIEQKSVFGEATWQFQDRWRLLAGFRWFESDQTSIQATTHGFGGSVTPPAGEIIGTTVNGNGVGRIRQSDSTFRPKFSLTFDLDADTLAYALYSEGFRVGGVNNANQPFAEGIPDTYHSDELKNFELGFKSEQLNGRLRLATTLFRIDWDNIQVEPRDPTSAIPFITNGGAARVAGLEWSLVALPMENLKFTFTGTYLFERELTEDQPALPGASPFLILGKAGDEIPNTTDLQLFTALDYTTSLFDRQLRLGVDASYRGRANTEFTSSNPFNIPLDSYVLVNLYAGMELSDQVRLGIYAKNVTDELAVYDGISTFVDPAALVAARPRTLGLTASFRF
jgi:outer membrane receptor protein involved in Fe transport